MNMMNIKRQPKYGIRSGGNPFDSHVYSVMKITNPERLYAVKHLTRRPGGLKYLYEKLDKFDEPSPTFSQMDPLFQKAMAKAIDKARTAFKFQKRVEPVDWDISWSNMRPETSAGLTYWGKKKGEIGKEGFDEMRYLAHRAKQHGNAVKAPMCFATSRGGESVRDEEPKTRLVWGYPVEVLGCEMIYSLPLAEGFKTLTNSKTLMTAGSWKELRAHIYKRRKYRRLTIDWSAFDTSIPSWLINVAFGILGDNIEWGTFDGKPTSIRDRQRWKKVWHFVKYYFINTPICMPDGYCFRKKEGIPSGSSFTSMIGSMCDYIIVNALAFYDEAELFEEKVGGDDSSSEIDKEISLSEWAVTAKRNLGMTMHVDKSKLYEVGEKDKFLGYQFGACGLLHRPTEEWFKLALLSKSHVPDPQRSLSRLCGLLLCGGCNDSEFVNFVTTFTTSFPFDPGDLVPDKEWLRESTFRGGTIVPDKFDWMPFSFLYHQFH